jgi:hypothetical protein
VPSAQSRDPGGFGEAIIAAKSNRTKRAFVFAVVGESHVEGLPSALKSLKRFSRADIVVLQSRSSACVEHDQVIHVQVPDELDNHQASIMLKTNPLAHLGRLADQYCYLDSDVIAVRSDVDMIFDELIGAVRFAKDHVGLDTFSRWAVRCGCRERSCNHLREAILCSFGIDVRRCDWALWNGGVFLFDQRAEEFLHTWHRMALQIANDPYWYVRDQGVLAATAWKLGLEDLKPLSQRFNFIVDRMWGIPLARRATATVDDFYVRNDYSLREDPKRMNPSLIHFINGGVGQKGWRHWDEVQEVITSDPGETSNLSQRRTSA